MLLMAGHRPFICGPKDSGALLPRVSRPALGRLILLDEDELPCARPGLRRQRRLAPGPEDLYRRGHRCFVAAWRVSSAGGRACVARPCSPASSSSSPELKVLLGGVERGGDEPTPDERALARLSRSCGVCGTAPLAKGGHDGRDRLHLRAERHPNCQAAAREQRDPSRSNPGGRAFPE